MKKPAQCNQGILNPDKREGYHDGKQRVVRDDVGT